MMRRGEVNRVRKEDTEGRTNRHALYLIFISLPFGTEQICLTLPHRDEWWLFLPKRIVLKWRYGRREREVCQKKQMQRNSNTNATPLYKYKYKQSGEQRSSLPKKTKIYIGLRILRVETLPTKGQPFLFDYLLLPLKLFFVFFDKRKDRFFSDVNCVKEGSKDGRKERYGRTSTVVYDHHREEKK